MATPVPLPRVKFPPAVPWTLGFVGLGLTYAALRNESPLAMLRGVITGNRSTRNAIDPVAAAAKAGAGGTMVDVPAGESGGNGGGGFGTRDPGPGPSVAEIASRGLIQVDNGATGRKVWMAAPAAGAYKAWQRLYGGPIPLTGAWRSDAAQAAGHAAEPGRFSANSLHPRGLAVDVDNDWLQGLPAEQQTKLRTTAKMTGWGQARYKRGEAGCGRAPTGVKSDNDEPWHFSFGACG